MRRNKSLKFFFYKSFMLFCWDLMFLYVYHHSFLLNIFKTLSFQNAVFHESKETKELSIFVSHFDRHIKLAFLFDISQKHRCWQTNKTYFKSKFNTCILYLTVSMFINMLQCCSQSNIWSVFKSELIAVYVYGKLSFFQC